ncbi:threonine--tRNA ligase [Clostridia bacterium]|nr:threonine--tRNA ligase [Clostridia bacterium]
MKITLKDTVKEYDGAAEVAEIARSIGEGLYRNATAGIVDGAVRDLRYVVAKDAEVRILTFEDADGKRAFWHTTAHILAQALKRLYPEVRLAIGPSIKDGFYYDIELEKTLTPEDFPAIEDEMKKIVKEELEITRFDLPRDEALAKVAGEVYKTELIKDLPDEKTLSFYAQGEFTDLCAGPHLLNTKYVKALKLLKVSGAYWRGDEKNKMLTRIYGISFTKQSELAAYLERIEEAKKRDHRKLGQELKLFAFLDEGQGFPFFLPNGVILKSTLINYWREIHRAAGYAEISTPLMLDKSLWERSGHWTHYKDNIYLTEIDEKEHALKPMNCPGAMLVYGIETRSYRDLPLRMAELGVVHRHEKSGALHGLMRVRCFTQDDAHIFLIKEQIKDEIKRVCEMIDKVYSLFGFKYHVELSTKPEDSMGSVEDWDTATNALREAITEKGLPFVVNEGDGAFYGPKLDFHLEDSLGRTWQCGTIQLDFQMPEKFDLSYVGSDGEKHRPVMIHRVLYGSIERFIGILVEHFAGKFPLWLAPVQAIVLPISDKFHGYAAAVKDELENNGIRVETDCRGEKIGFKIREARNRRIPYILVVGEKEEESKTVSLRTREGELGATSVPSVLSKMKDEIATKKQIV